jgi:hypothetical protein
MMVKKPSGLPQNIIGADIGPARRHCRLQWRQRFRARWLRVELFEDRLLGIEAGARRESRQSRVPRSSRISAGRPSSVRSSVSLNAPRLAC